ncbi:putative salicylate hydroxylase [Pseudoclavibacter endophyticus]|uniref:NAD(P)-binding protein n=1 Tax=Pseudoclavibacter endophyticus TaxID=1778590 RepID=A0A6H9WGC7_9MICO|nr:FAD-dependent monooxygenase [Pseudoclavibacter endophyticus]KAB1648064.1 NAD(P)-binding protein [Pseudoclavibacter endophyticus]GGA69398.1 putative salicylate hydroxylase [Pseudoclavibacter endophyticus]
MHRSAPRVAIVGGGIAGLFTANALLRNEIPVTVFEQARALGEIGAGVFLTPNGVRQLERIGVSGAVERVGVRVGHASRYHRDNGTEIATVQVTDSAGWNAVFGMHRADLVELLAGQLPEGVVRTGHRCVGLTQTDGGARLEFEDGSEADADVVIGADGIHSALREQVVPPATPVFSGSVAYRGLVPHRLVPDWPDDAWHMWLGEGRHFLTFPVRRGELVNYVAFVPAAAEMRESWSAPGDPDQLRREFSGWDERIGTLLSHVTETLRWGLYDRDPISTWTAGRLTLLGDAAHPMLPHLGQGANQAMEDGMALATVLADATAADAPARLQVYERLRRDRVGEVQRGARANGLRYDSAYEDLEVRDAEMRAHVEFRKWIYDYDVVEHAAEAA